MEKSVEMLGLMYVGPWLLTAATGSLEVAGEPVMDNTKRYNNHILHLGAQAGSQQSRRWPEE